MRTVKEIELLLNELQHSIADELEDQDLDFQEWNTHSMVDCVKSVVKTAISMANGGGGTVVFGVADHVVGREKALPGVPFVVDVHRLGKTVYENTDPKITPVFEELLIPEGTGRLLVMQIYPGVPPYTDSCGRGEVRVGKACRPLTGSFRRKFFVETGENDYTAEVVAGVPESLLSPVALGRLRELAASEKAPADMLQMQDMDLLAALGLVRRGRLTRAALLLAGTERAICEHIPSYLWTFLRMKSYTRYSKRDCQFQPLPKSIICIEEHIASCNAVAGVAYGNFHFESRTYPEKALREVLLNAFCHADYRINSPFMVKVYPDRIEVENPGGLLAGITPQNILHHPPASRNPLLVDALVRLRLVNRSNLGMSRMFEAFLIEGKQPPVLEEVGESVRVTMRACSLYPEFCAFIADYSQKGRLFSIDELLVFHHLFSHLEVNVHDAASLSHRGPKDAEDILAKLNREGFLEKVDDELGTYWTLQPEMYQAITGAGYPKRSQRVKAKAAGPRVRKALVRQVLGKEPRLNENEPRNIFFN